MSIAPGFNHELLIAWDDPTPALKAAQALSGLDYMQAIIAGELPAAPINALIGMTGLEVVDGRAVFRGEPGPQHLNSSGTVHGGFAATLLDTALGCAINTTLPAGVFYATVDLNVTFVCPITPDTGPVCCEGEVLHRGRTIRTASGRLTRESDGRLLAHATTTCKVFDP